ncbi:hypothetical protein CW745_03785 [Psychromonas sp. psych-6C06]|uniref:UPF0149 family protein n=1 Tax=Psychromonas sp. psych-6C06 TaxID=2058089 RepID=UPI000C32DA55|nr:UPF0149 family protein [Psychromonas sp. psych-6C06]PKF62557.1 hypothetical protein CW745_03785 [Psychromonas sp. psych-6C06]
MLSSAKIRAETIKFSALSSLQPDYYFIQGYIMGIGANPYMIPPSQWVSDLFGEICIREDENDGMQALMQLNNQQMEKILELDIKLPAKCVLSKNDFEASLAPDAPLPNWCLGMLKALKWIDKAELTGSQRDELTLTDYYLKTFSSLEKVKQIRCLQDDYQQEAHRAKRLLSTYINNLIYVMRFEQESDQDDNQQSEQENQFEEMMRFVMTESNPLVDQTIETMIRTFESQHNQDYLTQQKGHIWFDPEARPYMMLRARRAQLNFERGDLPAAIDELQLLLELNPNDNQANRYPLANYLIIEKRWQALANLLADYDEPSTFMLASKALMLFTEQGDSSEARAVKKRLKKQNKHLEKYLTGQAKAPKENPPMYTQGDKSEAIIYLSLAGKETWRSVDGALFWLRRK